uniref:Uncharacterized protein n=1 Tax=Haematobia irritans TaxID=7368 RepID=A0A1L8E7W4_HAEIR
MFGCTISKLKEKCTAHRMAVFFGVLCTILIVVVVVLAVDNADKAYDLKESRSKLEILELYIQSMASNETTSTKFTIPQLADNHQLLQKHLQ